MHPAVYAGTDIVASSAGIRQISVLEGQHVSQKQETRAGKSCGPSQRQGTIIRTGLHKCFAHVNLEGQTAKLNCLHQETIAAT